MNFLTKNGDSIILQTEGALTAWPAFHPRIKKIDR